MMGAGRAGRGERARGRVELVRGLRGRGHGLAGAGTGRIHMRHCRGATTATTTHVGVGVASVASGTKNYNAIHSETSPPGRGGVGGCTPNRIGVRAKWVATYGGHRVGGAHRHGWVNGSSIIILCRGLGGASLFLTKDTVEEWAEMPAPGPERWRGIDVGLRHLEPVNVVALSLHPTEKGRHLGRKGG